MPQNIVLLKVVNNDIWQRDIGFIDAINAIKTTDSTFNGCSGELIKIKLRIIADYTRCFARFFHLDPIEIKICH